LLYNLLPSCLPFYHALSRRTSIVSAHLNLVGLNAMETNVEEKLSARLNRQGLNMKKTEHNCWLTFYERKLYAMMN